MGVVPNPPKTSKLHSPLVLKVIIPQPRFLIGSLSGEILTISSQILVREFS